MHPIWRQAESVRHESGAVVVAGQHVASTLRCCHCGTHWIAVKGSGTKRGWCVDCKAVTCGASKCNAACIPFEALLEIQEGSQLKGIYYERYLMLYARHPHPSPDRRLV